VFDTFSRFGNILSCTVKTDKKGDSRGFAFVQFEAEASAARAIAEVNGKMILEQVVFVGPFKKKVRHSVTNNVFVKNFESEVTDEVFKRHFEKYGTITSCVVMKDGEGKSKCFGFVCFEDTAAAAAV
jgi:polyadenylate-binding protein